YIQGDKDVSEYFNLPYSDPTGKVQDFSSLSADKKAILRNKYKDELAQDKLEKEATEEPIVTEPKQTKETLLKPEELTSDEETIKSLAARKLAQETITGAPEKVPSKTEEIPIVGEKPLHIEQEVIPGTEEGAIKEKGTKKYSEEESFPN